MFLLEQRIKILLAPTIEKKGNLTPHKLYFLFLSIKKKKTTYQPTVLSFMFYCSGYNIGSLNTVFPSLTSLIEYSFPKTLLLLWNVSIAVGFLWSCYSVFWRLITRRMSPDYLLMVVFVCQHSRKWREIGWLHLQTPHTSLQKQKWLKQKVCLHWPTFF